MTSSEFGEWVALLAHEDEIAEAAREDGGGKVKFSLAGENWKEGAGALSGWLKASSPK
jgi:hypothetical protein